MSKARFPSPKQSSNVSPKLLSFVDQLRLRSASLTNGFVSKLSRNSIFPDVHRRLFNDQLISIFIFLIARWRKWQTMPRLLKELALFLEAIQTRTELKSTQSNWKSHKKLIAIWHTQKNYSSCVIHLYCVALSSVLLTKYPRNSSQRYAIAVQNQQHELQKWELSNQDFCRGVSTESRVVTWFMMALVSTKLIKTWVGLVIFDVFALILIREKPESRRLD